MRITSSRFLLCLAVLFLVINYLVVPIWPFFWSKSSESNSKLQYEKQNLSLLYIKLNEGDQHQVEQLSEQVSKQQADLVALLGSYSMNSLIKTLSEGFPYQISPQQPLSRALQFFSRFPVASDPKFEVGNSFPAIISCDLQLNVDSKLHILLLSALEEGNANDEYKNRVYLRRIATHLRHLNGEAIVAADLKYSPWSNSYKRFVSGAKLENAMHGFGLFRSFDMTRFLPRSTKDHIFYKGALRPQSFEALAWPGLRHAVYLVKFEFD